MRKILYNAFLWRKKEQLLMVNRAGSAFKINY
jgi:hypothetical protein